MKSRFSPIFGFLLASVLFCSLGNELHAGGVPEPGLIMYGTVRNATLGNAVITSGSLTWTIAPPSGSPVHLTTALTDIGGQYSYLLLVPFESVVGSQTLSSNVLQLNGVSTTYYRTNVTFSFGTNIYSVTFSNTAQGSFTFGLADRGTLEQVDLFVSAPGVGGSTNPPVFSNMARLSGGRFQMTVSGTSGQNYTLLTSTDLVHWSSAYVFTLTNSPATISDSTATNFPRRFYRLGP